MSATSTAAPLRVALVGGGLGGLAFGITILRAIERTGANIEFTLYEATDKFMQVGAGIAMGTNAVDCMRYMGLEKEYKKVYGEEIPLCQWRFGEDGKDTGPNNGLLGESILIHSTVHRAELLDIMIDSVPAKYCRFGKRLDSYVDASEAEGKPITLNFQDGTSAICDVLIGADGVKSAVRTALFKGDEAVAPIYTGTTASRGIISMDVMKAIVGDEQATHPQMYLGKDSHILTFPIQLGTTVNIVAFATDRSVPQPIWSGGAGVAPISLETLLGDFPKWGDKCKNILKAIHNPSRWALYELPNLPTYAIGSVCLVGDSCHATLPHQGAGASQAIEDGLILAEMLCNPLVTPSKIPQTLQIYDSLRRERSTRVKTTSNELGRIIEFAHEDYGEDKEKIVANLQVRYEWIWSWRAEESVRVANETLEREFKLNP